MSFATAVRIDHETDSACTTQDSSRYGAQLRRYAALFRHRGELSSDPVRFAHAAWQIAQPPITVSGYVRFHDRVLCAHADPATAHLSLSVDVASALPTYLCSAVTGGAAATWQRSPDLRFVEPEDDPHTTVVLPVLTMRVPVPADRLPIPIFDRARPRRSVAIEAVEAICDAINTRVGPVLDALAQRARPW